MLASLSAQENGTLARVQSWSEVLSEAVKYDKLIFVDCYFTGCLPCAQMDREVFPNPVVSEELKRNFVAIKVDVFTEKLGDSLNRKFGISGFPSFLVLDGKGRLVSMFVGYQDPSMLMGRLAEAREKAARSEYMSGISASFDIAYPDFYLKYYSRDDDRPDPEEANRWIKAQSDWTQEAVALPIFRTARLDTAIENYLVQNFELYKQQYGEELVMDKVASILNRNLKEFLEGGNGENRFRQFLANQSSRFPRADWKVFNFLLGYNYYGSIVKDSIGLLKFLNEEPFLYRNYFGALYNNMLVRNQLNETNLGLMISWVDVAVTEQSSIEMIRLAAAIHRKNNSIEGFKRFMNMAINKARKFQMPTAAYEKQLAASE
jgi:thiol-disulfide isomerase/thioredoxin